ncbi:RNA polymerase-binding protein DksA [uncultured Campylobacter sp.]|uniref:RNA polymerase-binding protein DksA n=1 Tax=uncultured Campylobacter sp. TaxID=218934 RepID=UPI00262E6550|nr:RNA polymerase-binding protein DksA [uncultured Campylobacter sp.]
MRKSDLEQFKALLLERKAQIAKNILDSSNEMFGLRQSGVSDEFDIASVNADQLIEQSISAQQRQELAEIEISLRKIADKTYGICEMCEEDIGLARLRVKPHAKYCITCREIVEKTAK